MRAALKAALSRTRRARAVAARVVAPIVVQGAPEGILARRALLLGLRRPRASRAALSRTPFPARGLVGARAAHLVGVGLVEIPARYLAGVESHEPGVGVHHVARVPARGHAREVALLDGAQDVGPDAQTAGRLGQVVAFALAGFPQDRSECHPRHLVTLSGPPRRSPRRPSASQAPWRPRALRGACCRSVAPRRPSLPANPLYAPHANSPP